jgi:hypothetical protein
MYTNSKEIVTRQVVTQRANETRSFRTAPKTVKSQNSEVAEIRIAPLHVWNSCTSCKRYEVSFERRILNTVLFGLHDPIFATVRTVRLLMTIPTFRATVNFSEKRGSWCVSSLAFPGLPLQSCANKPQQRMSDKRITPEDVSQRGSYSSTPLH